MFTKDEITKQTFRSFVRAQGLFRNAMKSYFMQFGISGAQWGILRILYERENEKPGGVKLKELGERLLVRPPSVTGVVDRLERMGFVTRTASADDQRAKKVLLTSRGKKIVERIHKYYPAQMEKMLGGLNQREQKDFLHLLQKFYRHLEALEKQFKGEIHEYDK